MRPSERLTTVFVAALAALALAGRPPSPGVALALLALAAATVLLARAAPGPGAGALVRDFFPIATVLAVYMLLEPVIVGVNAHRWDPVFAAIDARWFASLEPAWRNAFGRAPAFTDAAYLAYVSYYVLPIVAAVLAHRRGAAPFEAGVLALLLAFYGQFLGYVVFPTAGPRLPPLEEARVLGGGAISDAVRAFLHAAERTQLDAFPSGHTAVALVSAAVAVRLAPRWTPAFLAWAGAVVFSTVYIHVHYVVDVFAGAALAAASIVAGPALGRWFGRSRRPAAARG